MDIDVLEIIPITCDPKYVDYGTLKMMKNGDNQIVINGTYKLLSDFDELVYVSLSSNKFKFSDFQSFR